MNKKRIRKQWIFMHYKFFVMLFASLISIIFSTKVYAADIKATNISVTDKSSTIIVSNPSLNNGEITNNITFNEVNDYVVFELVIRNSESDKYKIESIKDNNTNKNLVISYDYSKEYFNGEKKIKIKMLYKNKLINQEKISLNDLKITLNLINDKGESQDIIINNPTTGDNILMYMIFLILAITGLIFAVKKTRVNGIKVGSIVILISMLTLPFAIFAYEKYEVNIKFTDIEIKGEFEKYNITINPGNGSAPIVKEVTYGEKIGELPTTPSKEGYEFEKWVDNKGNEVTEETIITGPISVEAKYKAVEYTISYDLNGGTVTGNPEKYTIESNNITLKNPSKEGYTFTGWTGTGIDTKTTSVTIEKGSTGNRNYTANYSAKTDTAYKVKHRYQKLESGYEEEEVTEYGETGSEVEAPIKSKTGFVDPSVQKVTIKADGTSEVIYNYDREEYTFSISDRTYIDNASTPDGNYPYETKIKVKAQERAGYDFVWSDGETDLEREFKITEPTSLNPVYTAKTNTPYKVVHQKQKLDGTYEVANTQILTGTTDSSITPEVKTYEGFTSPSTQTVTIKGDGTTVVTYNYDRIMYDFSTNDNENVISSKEDGSYPYGSEIELTAKEKQGYTFSKWSNDETTNPVTITLDSNLTIEPIYEANTDTAYKVVHQKQKIDGTYEVEETENKKGTTDSTITPEVKTYEGFTSPEAETTTIKGDGTTVVTYNYTRNKYTLTIENPEYVEEDKSGEYYYEEEVTLKAIDRQGYDFAGWSNGETTKEITVTIGTENITVKPIYTNRTDTTYKIEHEYERLNGDYKIEEEVLTGETGKEVEAPLKPKTGFVSPSVQRVTITADGKAKVTYTYNRERYDFSVTNRTNLENESTANGRYPYETEIYLKAKEKTGYTFAWSDEETSLERTFELTSNIELSLVYIPNIYTVKFDPNTGVGDMASQEMSYDEKDALTKNTFTKVGYIFVGWNTESDGTGTAYEDEEEVENLVPTGSITLYAQWILNPNTPYKVVHQKQKVTLDGYDIEETEDKTGTTGSSITPEVKTYEGFTSPEAETTTIAGDGSTVVTYNYDREEYTVTFDTDGGSEVADQTIIYGNKITKPTAPTKTGYAFDNWYTDDTYSTVFNFDTIITSDTTIYAKFDELKTCADNENITRLSENTCSNNENITIGDGIVCKRAVKLHEETCSQTSGDYYCSGAGYTESGSKGTSTITYGSCGTNGTLSSGDAFTCDVNGDGDFDELTERFYYVSDYYDTSAKGFDTSTAVLIYYNNVTSGVSCNKNTFAYDSSNENWHGPRTLVSQLPTTSQWSNVSLKSDTRAILAEYQSTHDSPTTGGETLPTNFSYEGYAARLLTAKELMSGCNLTEVGRKTTGELDSCNYIMENTRYAKSTIGSAGHWLETPYAFDSYSIWYVGGYYHSVHSSSTNNSNFGSARPVIEVPKSKIEYGASSVYTVTLNANGGSVNPTSITVNIGDAIGTLPTPTAPTGKSFAGWYTDLTGGIEVTSTYIPNADIEIYARYNNSTYTVSFDTDGGTSVSDIIVNQGDSIDTLPTTTKDDYIFDGWYENLTDTNSVSEHYTPTSDIELKAKWSKIICKKGTSLYTNECNSANGSGCRMKYAEGETITYGSIVSSDTFVGGDTLICDVDGTGYNEKFYYLRTIDDKAVLLHDKTMVLGSDTSDTHYVYSNAKNVLPSSSDWNQLPTTFEYDGVTKAARFPTLDDIKEATGVTNLTSSGALKNYSYLFEDIGKYTTTTGRSTVWIESDVTNVSTIYRLHVASDNVNNPTSTTSQNCVKPVIEVPINLISDDYVIRFNPNGGTNDNEYVRVKKGSSLGTLPTLTRTDYIFDGWYTSLDFTTKVNENTVPNGYLTYYAKWIKTVQQAIVNSENIVVQENDTSQLGITNSAEIEPYTLESNDTSIATVDQNGIITGVSAGETTITITGTLSHLTKTINVRVIEEVSEYTVSFDSQGGSAVSDMHVQKNTALGSLPTPPTKSGYDFIGWYTNTSYSVEVTVDTIITNDVTFVALWIPSDAVAEINGSYYTSIQDAVDDATTAKTTIKVIKDVTMTSFIDLFNNNTDKNIVLDLNGHTITNNTTQVVRTKTTLEIKNGTLKCGANNGTIDVEINGYLTISNSRVEQTATGNNGRAAIYNNGGKVVIGENMYITSNAFWTSTNGRKRGTVQNVKGTMTILGGTIINNRDDNTSYALSIEAGTVTVGTKDGAYDIESIVMQANQAGIYANANFSLYDGMVKGKTAAINDESKINSTEDNATKVKDTDDGYNRLYYTLPLSKYKVTFEANGGSVSPEFITIDIGDSVGELPTPTRGVYTFDGWYTGIDTGVEVTSTYVPEGNITIYARYHYEESENIENFNMTNDAMTVYYNRLNTWLSDESTFQTNMDANMDNFNCSKCTGPNYQECPTPVSGTTLCDQSKGYDTGISTSVKVYESNDSKEIGTEVTYTTSTNGTIYNMIPGKVYYWESTDDSNVHGYVKASGNRRTIKSNVRNVRDMGGLEVDTNNDGTVDGTIKYGKIFRGAKLSSSASDVTELTKLGITEEVDLRGSSSDAKFSNYKGRSITNYLIYPDTHSDNYAVFRQALVNTMQDVINGENIYFHCAIGTDRTGTMAYFLEGLLGVNEEDRVQDYELSYFTGLLNRHRFHDYLDGSSINPRFTTMHNTYKTNQSIYEFFMAGSTDTAADQQLIDDFRNAMIDYN